MTLAGAPSSGGVVESYRSQGFVVVSGLIPPELCQAAVQAFTHEVKTYPGFLYRQASARPERHRLDPSGFMLNSILNPLALSARRFEAFSRISQQILTWPSLVARARDLVGEPVMLVQSMYFEGNPATWAHQDTYYLDGERSGSMVGAWVALEDIHDAAGRFYVGVGSHRIDMPRNGGNFNIVEHHERYKALVETVIRTHRVDLCAPALRRGDVLFWNSRTIHGAHAPSQAGYSRHSYTAHFIPASGRFLQLQSVVRTLKPRLINDCPVFIPKDQNRLRNRLIFAVECAFPRTSARLKGILVKRKVR
ncbi:MAG: phytanoyl-CoA dioxygenase family protein [Candidatus Xenobia bacterium]